MNEERSTTNFLGSDVEINGSITLKQDITIDCPLVGDIQSEGLVVIGEHGEIQADIRAHSVRIHGRVHGNVTVQDRCELKPNAVLVGDLKAPRMVIEEGAVFVGRSEVSPRIDFERKASPLLGRKSEAV